MTTRLSGKQLLLSKIETSGNTDPTVAATNAILCSNLSVTPNAGNAIVRNRAYPNFGQSTQGHEVENSSLSFDVDIAGSGAVGTAPLYGPLLRACGFTETITASTKVVYTPKSSTFETLWSSFNADGTAHILGGMKGTVSAKFEANKEPQFTFNFMGLYHAPVDVAFLTGVATTLGSFVDPVTVSSALDTFTLFGSSPVLNSLTVDWGCKVVFNDKPGRSAIDIVDRTSTITVVVEADSVANMDIDSMVKNKTTGAMHMTHGNSAGNIVTVDATLVQILKAEYTDVNGVLHRTLTLAPVGGATDDQIDITVK